MIRLILVLAALVFVQCGSSQTPCDCDSLQFESYSSRSLDYYNRAYFTGDPSLLDSALFVVEEAIERCPNYAYFFILRKIGYLSDKKDYRSALEFIRFCKKSDFLIYGSYYQEVLENRFLAMQAQTDGEIGKRNEYLKKCIELSQSYLDDNLLEVNEFLNQSSNKEIYRGSYAQAIIQNMYFYSIVYGVDDARNRLIEMKKLHPNAAELYNLIEEIFNQNFMDFVGF